MKIILAILCFVLVTTATFLLGAFVQKNYDLISTRQDTTSEDLLRTQKALMYQIQRIAPLNQPTSETTTTTMDYSNSAIDVESKLIDLNNDGVTEIMERTYGKDLCGASNCPTAVYRIINGKRITLLDVGAQSFPKVLDTVTVEFKDLQFGPDANGTITVWKWNGEEYDVSK